MTFTNCFIAFNRGSFLDVDNEILDVCQHAIMEILDVLPACHYGERI